MKIKQKKALNDTQHYKITLRGETIASVERYCQYYAHLYSESIRRKMLIPEIIAHFIASDREFRRWQQKSFKQDARLGNTKMNTV